MTDISFYFFLFLSLSVIHFGYDIYFLVGLWRKPSYKSHHEGASIVVAARNEVENLKELIPKLFNQNHDNFEVVVALNYTHDGSYEALLDMKKKYTSLSIVDIDKVPDHINAKKYAITLAIKAAKNDIIILTDADCKPVSDLWVAEMVNGFANNKEIVLGYSPYERTTGLVHFLTQFDTRQTAIQYMASGKNRFPYMGVGRNLAYRKKFFIGKNGFNGFQNIKGGDDDLFVNKHATSKNTYVQLSPQSFVTTKPEKNLKRYYKQKLRHLSVGKYYNMRSKMFLGLFSLAHLGIWLLGFLLLFSTNYAISIPVIFLITYLPFLVIFVVFNRKSRSKFAIPLVILMDVVFSFFYIFVGIHAMFTKRIEWTN